MKFKIIILFSFLINALSLFAQESAAIEATRTSSNNQLVIVLVIVMLLLAFVIWGLGKALIAISKQVNEKHSASSKSLLALIICFGASIFQSANAQYSIVEQTAKIEPNYGGLSSTSFYLFACVIGIELIAIAFLTISIKRMYAELMPPKVSAKTSTFNLMKWWNKFDQKYFTKAIPIEQEADRLLDHDYDGIKELDNALPPWWKYGFYVTIIFSAIYLLNFHVLDSGKDPIQEYSAEMKQAQIDKEIFEANNKDKVDEKNITMADASGLQKAKNLYEIDCWACHGKKGEGGAGPNLTDDYWLHKGSLNDIYASIKNGYPDKGMQAWAVKYTPKEMSFLASYIKTLRGTNPPNAKAAQGDLFVEEKADTTVIKKETSISK
ncbi:MAG: c-type cytochrome [Chitinophagaceae bacterium]|nr:c-type cytochrome [Chitinophagaceae bacterium]